MISAIRKHFFKVDPIYQYRQLTYQVITLELFALWLYLYIQPPYAFFLILIPLLHIVPANFFYTFQQKFAAKCFAFFVFSSSLLLLSILRPWGVLIVPFIFIFAFFVLLFAYFGPPYRSIACLSMLISFPNLFYPMGWYGASNVILSCSIMILASLIVDYVFIFWQRNTVELCYKAIVKLFIERLQICLNAIINKNEINFHIHQEMLQREMALRKLIIEMVKIPEKNPQRIIYDDLFIALIKSRQSLYAIFERTNDDYEFANADDKHIIKVLVQQTQNWYASIESYSNLDFESLSKSISKFAATNTHGFGQLASNYLYDLQDLLFEQKKLYAEKTKRISNV